MTAAQVEASLNRKNVEVVQGDRSATLLLGDAVDALGGVGAEADDAWVPDQETGVFVPAEEAAGTSSCSDGPHKQPAGQSVLDQAWETRRRRTEEAGAGERRRARRGAGRTG